LPLPKGEIDNKAYALVRKRERVMVFASFHAGDYDPRKEKNGEPHYFPIVGGEGRGKNVWVAIIEKNKRNTPLALGETWSQAS